MKRSIFDYTNQSARIELLRKHNVSCGSVVKPETANALGLRVFARGRTEDTGEDYFICLPK